MSDAFIGEIRIFPASYVPNGWLNCNGAILPVSQFQALFAVIGNLYGGNVTQGTFALPNLNGDTGSAPSRAVCGIGQASGTSAAWALTMVDGTNFVTLTQNQLPPHTHQMIRSGGSWVASKKLAIPAGTAQVSGLYVDATTTGMVLTANAANATLTPQAVTATGGSHAHENRQPYLACFFAINYDGEYPVPS